MTLSHSTIKKGFIISGLMNMSVLIFSRLFTNNTITEFDPNVMSSFGLLMINIWGLAYISVAKKYALVPWLVAVFAIEKLIYGYVWIQWLLNNDISKVYKEDVMAGMFYSVYGINDLLFCIFFLIIFLKVIKK
ncbi:hypothetical protein ULMS_26410 [Patiriisocius marinistellae]|uniref:Uncharacterized protein n=1 Tax=Patiriisocius marinistellae TaxID=2494560 RepID=A0A5J4FYK6_9FLAO|nr:hypothetical protein [Patiriisocius marinistellae]GEQ87133.1 hypothetical protein ULMS_26410 [Patiriisocius marinistellae]